MTHTYQITGMTCGGCVKTVESSLSKVPGVKNIEVDLKTQSVKLTTDSHIEIEVLQNALGGADSKYKISLSESVDIPTEPGFSLSAYKPILLIFSYITAVTLLIQLKNPNFNYMEAMRHFMAGFFLVFSFFKLLNLTGFAESYVMYDVIARRLPSWPYVYAFIELALGLAFLVNFNPIVTNAVTILVMSVSIIGVLQSVMNRRRIQCACLGAVFNLPMSTVTIIEDALMILMSLAMLVLLL